MKMAKASQADLDAAIGICSALEAIDRGFMPEGFDTDDGDRANFDIDDARDCRNVLVHLLDLVGNGSIGRVVWGMSVLLDPNNEAVDPDLDYIEHHPKRIEGNKAVEQRDELLAEMRVIEDILNRETNTTDIGYEVFRRTNFIRSAIATTERES